jgi:hypothetical protein
MLCPSESAASSSLNQHGRSSGFTIDPIEKKPLNHYYSGSSVLSFGAAGPEKIAQKLLNLDVKALPILIMIRSFFMNMRLIRRLPVAN